MLARCLNPNDDHFPAYGARGITSCDRWTDFANFLADMGERPAGMTLERMDNDGNYEPGNCRWATAKEQARNRRGNRQVEFRGRVQPLSAWADELGMSYAAILYRIDNGYSIEAALTRPLRPDHRRTEGYRRPAKTAIARGRKP